MQEQEDKIRKIAEGMLPDFPSMGIAYLTCIAREGMKGVEAYKQEKNQDRMPLGRVGDSAFESISRYFCAWSIELNKSLSISFATSLANVEETTENAN